LIRRVEKAGSLDLAWPHLQGVVRAPFRAAIARRIFFESIKDLRLQVLMPDGQVAGGGRGDFRDGGDPAIRITDPECFFSRLGRDGDLGFGEAYMLGACRAGRGGTGDRVTVADCDELVAWLRVYALSLKGREAAMLSLLRTSWFRSLPTAEQNSVAGARRNVQAHYDLDTRLFELFLDPSMSYSSAWFVGAGDLASAQQRKIDSILDLAHVREGTRLLDMGCGFGGLALRAAAGRGALVTGITLSEKQFSYADSAAGELRAQGQARFMLADYREHEGTYDSITSVEMIEAVGSAYWPVFFKTVDRLLVPGGHFALQAITLPHEKMLAGRGSYSWVDRYIFPGGELPSLRMINDIVDSSTRLEMVVARRLSDSYARTLRAWRCNFLQAADGIISLGFDDIFIRLWSLYFSYFEAAFQARYCDVWQLGFDKRDPAADLRPADFPDRVRWLILTVTSLRCCGSGPGRGAAGMMAGCDRCCP
jgi:cyclopropane-fatty-acyl-phospholipid synthase